jgi:hypothetical protein
LLRAKLGGGRGLLSAQNGVDDQMLSQFLTPDDPLELADCHVSMALTSLGLSSQCAASGVDEKAT